MLLLIVGSNVGRLQPVDCREGKMGYTECHITGNTVICHITMAGSTLLTPLSSIYQLIPLIVTCHHIQRVHRKSCSTYPEHHRSSRYIQEGIVILDNGKDC
jgi:hypothetical protein